MCEFEEVDSWGRGWYPRGIALKIGKSVVRLGYVLDDYEMERFWYRHLGRDVYANVFGYEQIQANMYDTFFLDIDAHLYDNEKRKKIELPIEEAYNRMRNILDKLDDFGLSRRTYFSGRGFHIYIDFETTYIEDFGRVAIYFMNDVLDETFGYVDTRALVDKNRVARVPYTYNTSANRFMIPIDENWDMDTILLNSKECKGYAQKVRRNKIADVVVEYDRQIKKKFGEYDYAPNEIVPEIYDLIRDVDKMPKCIRDSVKELILTGELDHYRRLHMATFLLRVWSYDDVLELLSFAKDFNERMTRYQLNYILRRDLMPFSCKKAMEQGICTAVEQNKCLWKYLSNGWIGSIFADREVLENEEDVFDNDDKSSV